MNKIYIWILLAVSGLFFFNFFSLNYHLKNNGSPGGNTGAPGQWSGRTCANPACHSGTASFHAGMISSDIPASGFIPGETYLISGTVSEPGRSKYGFEISPQDSNGNLLGSITIINSVETRFTNQGKSVTHTSAGNIGASGSKTWTFSWTAPSGAIDDVIFWGGFNAANGDNTSSGDIIYRSLLAVEKDTGAVTSLSKLNSTEIYIYPNPFVEEITLSIPEKLKEKAIIKIFDSNEGLVYQELASQGLEKLQLDLSHLPAGQYFISLQGLNEQKLVTKRIIKTSQSVF